MKIIFLAIIFLFLLGGCSETTEVTNFEECMAAGNPAMESYPRQCKHEDRIFTEELTTQNT